VNKYQCSLYLGRGEELGPSTFVGLLQASNNKHLAWIAFSAQVEPKNGPAGWRLYFSNMVTVRHPNFCRAKPELRVANFRVAGYVCATLESNRPPRQLIMLRSSNGRPVSCLEPRILMYVKRDLHLDDVDRGWLFLNNQFFTFPASCSA
jgi:hypothetical protein